MKKMLVAISVATALTTSIAVATEYNYEITPVIGGVMPEGNLDLDDQLYYGLKFGKNIGDYWFNKVEVGFEFAPRIKVKNSNLVNTATGFTKVGKEKKVDIFRGTLNFVKEIPMTKYFSFYGLLGGGFEALSDNWRGNNDRFFVDYGAGMKYRITEQLALNVEARHGIKINASATNDVQNNLFYSLGLSYAWGEIKADAPVAPKAEPVVEVKKEVVEEVVIGDDDGDGVLNNVDECPNTPKGVPVDEKGCAKTISLHVNFNFDKSNILPKYDEEINKVADFMNKYPVYKVMLEGYTDSTGPEAYNLTLSDKRAAAVANALKNKGVSSDKISTVGYGESKPVATNKTREGRAENRRVDAVFSY